MRAALVMLGLLFAIATAGPYFVRSMDALRTVAETLNHR